MNIAKHKNKHETSVIMSDYLSSIGHNSRGAFISTKATSGVLEDLFKRKKKTKK
jgi:hypothetical protein